MARKDRHEDDRFSGGAEYIEEEAGDHPGRARGPGLLVVVILALLALAMPVAWGIGILATLGKTLGTAALVALWIVWLIVAVLFIGTLWGMWRRGA